MRDRETISMFPSECPFCLESAPKPHTCGCAEMWATAAGLIKKELWLGRGPPESPDDKPWTMGRACSVYRGLLRSGWSPAEIQGAIEVLNTVKPYSEPRRMTNFYGTRVDKDTGEIVWVGTPTMEVCVHYWREREFRERKWRGKSMMGDGITIKLEVT